MKVVSKKYKDQNNIIDRQSKHIQTLKPLIDDQISVNYQIVFETPKKKQQLFIEQSTQNKITVPYEQRNKSQNQIQIRNKFASFLNITEKQRKIDIYRKVCKQYDQGQQKNKTQNRIHRLGSSNKNKTDQQNPNRLSNTKYENEIKIKVNSIIETQRKQQMIKITKPKSMLFSN